MEGTEGGDSNRGNERSGGGEVLCGVAAERLTCSDPGNRFLDTSLLIKEEEGLWRAAGGRREKEERGSGRKRKEGHRRDNRKKRIIGGMQERRVDAWIRRTNKARREWEGWSGRK